LKGERGFVILMAVLSLELEDGPSGAHLLLTPLPRIIFRAFPFGGGGKIED
jgi:hypothetical protein